MLAVASAFATTPTLTSINPTSGAQGAAISVILFGNHFDMYSGGPTVNTISGVTVSIYSYGTQQINATFTISSDATLGARTVTVTTTGGTSSGITFIVVPPTPTLSSISPPSGTVGTTVPITLTGTNLSGATIYALSGITFSSVSSTSTKVTANFIIDAGTSTGAQSVNVHTAGGSSGAVTFTVIAPPANTRRVIVVN
jgi:hypothetical protein